MSSPPLTTPANSVAAPAARRATTPELVLVLGIPTALFLTSAFGSAARHAGRHIFTDSRVGSTLVVELVLAALFLPLLRRRGWRPEEAAGAPEPSDLLRGAGVWFAAMVSYYVVWVVVASALPAWADTVQSRPLTGQVSDGMIVAMAFFNPLFEEFLWLGYGVPALASRLGLRGACFVSLTLRLAVHAYQGPLALVGVLPATAVFTWYYARTRRLWPVVVAHEIIDALSLVLLTAGHR